MYTAAACGLESNNSAVSKQAPGTSVPQNCALSFKCYEGYYLHETFNENLIVLCINGKWLEKIPVCKSKLQFALTFLIKCIGQKYTNRSLPLRCSLSK